MVRFDLNRFAEAGPIAGTGAFFGRMRLIHNKATVFLQIKL